MKYVLEHVEESARLEYQSSLDGYSLSDELGSLPLGDGARVLDAGCGTGLVSRYLFRKNPLAKIEGCDGSELRLQEAKKLSSRDINYFEAQLDAIPVSDGTYDIIICRYVFEHLLNHQTVANEFHRILKNQGRVRIINFDGVIYNLFGPNQKLQAQIERVRMKSPYDLCIGRKIPSILKCAGFSQVRWNVHAIQFSGDQLIAEKELTKTRFMFAKDLFVQCLGESEAAAFVRDYLAELDRDDTVLFYNKFIIEAVKI